MIKEKQIMRSWKIQNINGTVFNIVKEYDQEGIIAINLRIIPKNKNIWNYLEIPEGLFGGDK